MDAHHPTPLAEALSQATVLVIGVGGLGAPCAEALAEAGVGHLILVDPDVVESSNLHRQLLYGDDDLGRSKVGVAAARLQQRVPSLVVTRIPERFAGVWDERFARADVVVDGTDTVATKFVVNDAAVRAGVPLVHAGAIGWQGQLLTVLPGVTACYRCIFEDAPPPEDTPSCHEAGVIGPAVTFAGALQTAEVLRLLCHEAPRYADHLLSFDLATGRTRHVPVARRAGCPTCDGLTLAAVGRSLHP